MGGCGNRNNCCKKNLNAVEEFKFQPEEILDTLQDVSAAFINKLQEIAVAGLGAGKLIRGLSIKNAALERLAKQIADMAVENAYFKSVVNLMAPMDIGVTDSVFEFNFGPKHVYSLKIPITENRSRAEIAKQLRAAADKLEAEVKPTKPPYNPDQRLLPFFDHAR